MGIEFLHFILLCAVYFVSFYFHHGCKYQYIESWYLIIVESKDKDFGCGEEVVVFYEYEIYRRVWCSRHPIVKWAQRSDKLYLTVELPDAKDVKLKLEPEGKFSFSATKDDIPYEADIEFWIVFQY